MDKVTEKYTDFRIIVILCLVVSVGRFSLDSYLPSLPSIAYALSVTPEKVQLTLTYYFFGFGASQFIYGPLSEKYGRRNPLFIGMMIFLLGGAMCATAKSITMLTLGRLLAGIGAGAGGVLARTIVTDWFPDDKVAYAWSHVSTAIVISLILGPLAGGFVQEYLGFRYNFWLSFLYGLVVLVILFYWLPETHDKKHRSSIHVKKIMDSYVTVLKDSRFMLYMLCATLAFSTLVIFFQVSPFIFITEFSYSPIEYGFVLLWIAFSYIAGGQFMRYYSKIWNKDNLILVGAGLIFLAFIVLLLWQLFHFPYLNISILLPAFLFVIGARVIIPTGLGAGLTLYRHMAGYASALSGGVQMLGGTIISYIIAELIFLSPLNRLILTLFFMSVCIVLLIKVIQRSCHPERSEG